MLHTSAIDEFVESYLLFVTVWLPAQKVGSLSNDVINTKCSLFGVIWSSE